MFIGVKEQLFGKFKIGNEVEFIKDIRYVEKGDKGIIIKKYNWCKEFRYDIEMDNYIYNETLISEDSIKLTGNSLKLGKLKRIGI